MNGQVPSFQIGFSNMTLALFEDMGWYKVRWHSYKITCHECRHACVYHRAKKRGMYLFIPQVSDIQNDISRRTVSLVRRSTTRLQLTFVGAIRLDARSHQTTA